MNKRKILLFLLAIVVLVSCVWLYCGTFQLMNPRYLLWVYSDNECPADYYEKYVFADPLKSRIIRGLSPAEIKKRFPVVVDGDGFPKDSYRGTLLQNWRNHNDYKDKNLKIFWFDNASDKMGWAITIINDKGFEIYPMKG